MGSNSLIRGRPVVSPLAAGGSYVLIENYLKRLTATGREVAVSRREDCISSVREPLHTISMHRPGGFLRIYILTSVKTFHFDHANLVTR